MERRYFVNSSSANHFNLTRSAWINEVNLQSDGFTFSLVEALKRAIDKQSRYVHVLYGHNAKTFRIEEVWENTEGFKALSYADR